MTLPRTKLASVLTMTVKTVEVTSGTRSTRALMHVTRLLSAIRLLRENDRRLAALQMRPTLMDTRFSTRLKTTLEHSRR